MDIAKIQEKALEDHNLRNQLRLLADYGKTSSGNQQLLDYYASRPGVLRYNIARDFTDTPGGRKLAEHSGPGFSGEELRAIIKPLLQSCVDGENIALVIILDGVAGYAASFLDEVFVGLLDEGFTYEQLTTFLILRDEEGDARKEIQVMLREEEESRQQPVWVIKGPFGRGNELAYYILGEIAGLKVQDLATGATLVFQGTRAEAVLWKNENPIVK